MQAKMYLGAVGLALLALMMGSMAWPLAYTMQPVAASSGSEAQREAALIFVKLANQTVNRILRLAEANNITIPSNMTGSINETLRLLSQAYREAEENPLKAVNTTLKALEIFSSVSRYVLGKLSIGPSVSRQALLEALERQGKLIENMGEKINETAEKQGLTVPEGIYNNLTEYKNTLLKIREELEAGNITVSQAARSIGLIRVMLAKSIHKVYGNISREAFKHRSIGLVVDRIGAAVIAVEKAVNMTIEALENNRTGMAEEMLNASIRAVDRAINTSVKVEVFVGKHNIDNNASSILENIKESLREVKSHLIAARNYLKNGDKANAISELEAAQEKLTQLITYLKDHLSSYHGRLIGMLHRCNAMHERLERAAKKHGAHRGKPLRNS